MGFFTDIIADSRHMPKMNEVNATPPDLSWPGSAQQDAVATTARPVERSVVNRRQQPASVNEAASHVVDSLDGPVDSVSRQREAASLAVKSSVLSQALPAESRAVERASRPASTRVLADRPSVQLKSAQRHRSTVPAQHSPVADNNVSASLSGTERIDRNGTRFSPEFTAEPLAERPPSSVVNAAQQQPEMIDGAVRPVVKNNLVAETVNKAAGNLEGEESLVHPSHAAVDAQQVEEMATIESPSSRPELKSTHNILGHHAASTRLPQVRIGQVNVTVERTAQPKVRSGGVRDDSSFVSRNFLKGL
ncbi:MAG: hypothetical protein L3J89_11330 [Gammaproteobacteria bacterium]|nr:hypothetical protein [Gammaproteobacteria bacterium]